LSFVVTPLAIPEVLIVSPIRHSDSRGFFSETYSKIGLAEAGVVTEFVQDNHALSIHKGTVRGLHFQAPPYAQDKLVRVVRGAIFDVAVDVRVGSPTYGQHVSATISAQAWNQIFVPAGFAHGLVTLEPDTEVIYKVSNVYSPEHDKGLLWNDPDLGIDWPVAAEAAILSEKDESQPTLDELPAYSHYALLGGKP
jgi:dTDP-4-dehydrorhamnose 3,5-epimerase